MSLCLNQHHQTKTPEGLEVPVQAFLTSTLDRGQRSASRRDQSAPGELLLSLDCVQNVMTHAQKPDFVFRRNGRVNLNRQSTTGSRGVSISGSNAGYTMFRGSAKSTGYPLLSPVCPSLHLPCVTVCHHVSTGVYHKSSCTLASSAFSILISIAVGIKYDVSNVSCSFITESLDFYSSEPLLILQ